MTRIDDDLLTKICGVWRQSLEEWKGYLSRIDVVIGEVFKMCLIESFNAMHLALHGDGTAPPSPLILVHVELIENKVTTIQKNLTYVTYISLQLNFRWFRSFE